MRPPDALSNLTYSIISVLIFALISGCMSGNGEPQFPSQVELNLELSSIGPGTVITEGDDQIAVGRIRLLHGASFFRSGIDTLFLLNSFSIPVVEDFTPPLDNVHILVEGNFVEGSYELLNIQFPTATDEDSEEIDPGFIGGDGGRYSMIIEGSYNGEPFTYNSSRSFEKVRNFLPALDVSEYDITYVFFVSMDAADWFLAEDGASLLDPSDIDNSSMIDDNISASIDISIVQDS